jgi:sulfhydrogenase subunit beta (sulfur reductase)
MIDRVISKSELDEFLDQLSVERQVVAPVSDGKFQHFRRIDKAAEIADDYLPTALPPSLVVLPPKETLLCFNCREKAADVQPQFDDHEIVLFGIRPCDLHALALLDAIFDEDKHDGHYTARRRNLTTVGIECLQPCDEDCFCESMGTLTVEEGFDLLLTDLGDAFYVRVGTTKGKELVDSIPAAREAVYEDRAKLRRAHERREETFEPRLDAGVDQLPSLLAESSDSLLWDVLGEKCLSCGACTTVCPTCYCFDVHDDINLDLESGTRYRTWDSCQLDEFAMVGTGESFRKPRSLRVKHRFNRKGHYIRERYGLAGCVGCGRCGRMCLVDIKPIEVFNQLKGQPVER